MELSRNRLERLEPLSTPITLRVTWPFGRVAFLPLGALILISASAEAAARLMSIGQPQTNPVISGDFQLGVKIGLLNAFARDQGGVDCVFIGSSMVQRGIDPLTVVAAYERQTGKAPRCFNLGVHGLNVSGAAALAEILIRHYQPRLIIYGANFRDFAGDNGFDLDIPWARHKLGRLSIQGWLEAESVAYQGYLSQADPMLTGVNWADVRSFESRISPVGYLPDNKVALIAAPPDPVAESDAYAAMAGFNPQVAAAQSGFAQFLGLKSDRTALLIIEMPTPPATTAYLPHGGPDYVAFSDLLQAAAQARGVAFWATRDLTWLPETGWQGYFHLNDSGAQVFSAWLGGQLADAVLSGQFPILPSEAAMEITSWTFAGFVIVAAAVYYLLPRRAQNVWLLLASYGFYVTLAWQFALTLALVTGVNFLLARGLRRDGQGRPGLLWAGIALNILTLAFFKYADFFVPQALALLGAPNDALKILLPVGLSYVTLQMISYLVDVYRGQLEAARDPVDFGLYLAYFPKLISGPIERARAFLPKLAEPRIVDNETLGRSGALIAIGLIRKIVFANVLARAIPPAVFDNPLEGSAGGLTLAVWLIAYGVYLFNDFAGYTSIVRGISLLFGIELSPNFQTPYFARNFTEFWNQWHISLSHWLRDYIFLPVSRALLRRNNDARYLPNVVIPPIVTMLVSGLWHGATLNLLFWGLLHGLYQAIERLQTVWRPLVPPDKQPIWRQALGIGMVFVLAMLAWVPFRSALPAAFQFYQGLATWGLGLEGVNWHVFIIILPALWLDFAQARTKDELFVRRWPQMGQAVALAMTILLIVMASAGSQPPFVYQGF